MDPIWDIESSGWSNHVEPNHLKKKQLFHIIPYSKQMVILWGFDIESNNNPLKQMQI